MADRIDSGQLKLFTFKAGVLARAAHDLRLSVEQFDIERDGDRLKATFDPLSIRVDGAMKGDQLDPRSLSPSDRDEIQRTLQKAVLEVSKYPRIEYSGTLSESGDGVHVEGDLHLHGCIVRLPIRVDARKGRLLATVTLAPSQWGIAPYKALLGALQLQDRVRLELDVADPR